MQEIYFSLSDSHAKGEIENLFRFSEWNDQLEHPLGQGKNLQVKGVAYLQVYSDSTNIIEEGSDLFVIDDIEDKDTYSGSEKIIAILGNSQSKCYLTNKFRVFTDTKNESTIYSIYKSEWWRVEAALDAR